MRTFGFGCVTDAFSFVLWRSARGVAGTLYQPVESYFTRSLLAASLFSYERRPALSRVRGSRGRARCESVARAMGRSNGDMVFEVRRLFCRPACWPFYGSASVVAFFWLDLLSRAARP